MSEAVGRDAVGTGSLQNLQWLQNGIHYCIFTIQIFLSTGWLIHDENLLFLLEVKAKYRDY